MLQEFRKETTRTLYIYSSEQFAANAKLHGKAVSDAARKELEESAEERVLQEKQRAAFNFFKTPPEWQTFVRHFVQQHREQREAWRPIGEAIMDAIAQRASEYSAIMKSLGETPGVGESDLRAIRESMTQPPGKIVVELTANKRNALDERQQRQDEQRADDRLDGDSDATAN